MKKRFFQITAVFVGVFILTASTPQVNKFRDVFIIRTIMEGLKYTHYEPVKVDDNFSNKVFKLYLDRLDYSKKFLLQSDVDQLAAYKDKIDNEINDGTTNFFDLSLKLIKQRTEDREKYFKEILAKPFDYSTTEEIETDPEKLSFAKTEADLKIEWKKYLHYQTMMKIHEMMETQEQAIEKKDTSVKILPFDTLEVRARKKVEKNTAEWFKRLKKLSDKDRFAYYVNTLTAIFDPHTEYFPPREKKQFEQSMSGQLEGIGARLNQKDGVIKVVEIIVGSPSYKQGQLKAGDAIIKVAQGAGEPVEVTDMDLNEAIELIKGKKGTEVRLTVKKPDGSTVVIPIVRDVVQLDETFAQSAVIQNNNKKIGYVKLPVFYTDFTHNGARRCAEDVKQELIKLKGEGVESVVIDLRDNGGGSLNEAVELAGHFIKTGPVVQVLKKGTKPNVLFDTNAEVVWDGPLVVMVNRGSASASEIFAAAMQDYKRGVVVGSTQSFGKGTVQQFLDLDNFVDPSNDTLKPLGALKVTIQKFYRINGGATQVKGVSPDVVMPDPYAYLEIGEKEMDYVMPWDEIAAASYSKENKIEYDKIVKGSKERIKNNTTFTLIENQAQYLRSKKDLTKYSLNLNKFRAEEKKMRDESKKFSDITAEIKDFKVNISESDKIIFESDTLTTTKYKKWTENLSKDVYLFEASSVAKEIKK